MIEDERIKRELVERSIDAILIGFRRNLYRGYRIPDVYRLQKQLSDVYLDLKNKKSLKKRIEEGILATFSGFKGEDIDSALDFELRLMFFDHKKYSTEWFQ